MEYYSKEDILGLEKYELMFANSNDKAELRYGSYINLEDVLNLPSKIKVDFDYTFIKEITENEESGIFLFYYDLEKYDIDELSATFSNIKRVLGDNYKVIAIPTEKELQRLDKKALKIVRKNFNKAVDELLKEEEEEEWI
jgi:hypothetical protein